MDNKILQEFKTNLSALFGTRLSRLIVYGSNARGEATADSDIDILVVLKTIENYLADWNKALATAAELSYHYDTLISVLITTEEEFISKISPLFVNIRKEGLIA
ncbi:MAG: nucleotidyltransferase domain-containing protein [Planctomycetota bacterium]|nr:nucleotidyltransferase domain-containing protein [Planctomycetota bacterium]MDI6787756.1 nucleotidyltransferase domain-containing protein [Planctomycetota bacterium]